MPSQSPFAVANVVTGSSRTSAYSFSPPSWPSTALMTRTSPTPRLVCGNALTSYVIVAASISSSERTTMSGSPSPRPEHCSRASELRSSSESISRDRYDPAALAQAKSTRIWTHGVHVTVLRILGIARLKKADVAQQHQWSCSPVSRRRAAHHPRTKQIIRASAT